MKNSFKRLLSAILILAMITTMLPAQTLAVDTQSRAAANAAFPDTPDDSELIEAYRFDLTS